MSQPIEAKLGIKVREVLTKPSVCVKAGPDFNKKVETLSQQNKLQNVAKKAKDAGQAWLERTIVESGTLDIDTGGVVLEEVIFSRRKIPGIILIDPQILSLEQASQKMKSITDQLVEYNKRVEWDFDFIRFLAPNALSLEKALVLATEPNTGITEIAQDLRGYFHPLTPQTKIIYTTPRSV